MKKLFTLLVVLCFMCEAFAENHLFEMSTSQAKTNHWDWGVSYQLATPLVKGTKYKLTLKASTTDNNFTLICFWPYEPLYNEDGTPQLNQWGGQATATQYLGFGIDNEFIERQVEFIADYDLTTLVFNFGKLNGKLFFDDIKLVKEGTDDNLIIDGDFENGSEFVSNWKFEGNKPTTYAIKVEDFTPDPVKLMPLALRDIKTLTGTKTDWASTVSYPKEFKHQGEAFGDGNGDKESTHVSIKGIESIYFHVNKVTENGNALRVWIWDATNNRVVTLYPYPEDMYETANFTLPYTITKSGTYRVKVAGYDYLKGVKAENQWGIPNLSSIFVDYSWVCTAVENPVAKAIDGFRHFSCSKALDFSSVNGVEAYIVPECEDGKVYMKKVKDVVPANTGLLLKSELNEFSITIPAVKPFDSTLVNLLVPVAEETEITKAERGNNYLFDGEKWVAVEEATPLNAGSSYLKASSSYSLLEASYKPLSSKSPDFIDGDASDYDPNNGLAPSDELPGGSIESPVRPENGLVTFPKEDSENADAVGTVTGIDNAQAGKRVARINSVGGALLNKLQKGVNIVTYSDGSRATVIIR